MHKRWENTVIATAWISAGALKVESNSVARADDLRRRIEAACTGLVRHRGREHSDPFALVERSPTRASEREPLSEEVLEVLRKTKADLYADWPDHPLPALGGLTPRAAVRTKRGREQVDLLLRDFENGEARLPAGERVDFSDLRVRLGLQK